MEDTISSTFHRKHKKTIKQKQRPHSVRVPNNKKRKPMKKKQKKPNKISDSASSSNNDNATSHDHCHNGDDDDGEKEEVERKIRALQRIVPGGESLGVDQLFHETAGYIVALQTQLKAMKTLASFFQGLHKQSRKFGA